MKLTYGMEVIDEIKVHLNLVLILATPERKISNTA